MPPAVPSAKLPTLSQLDFDSWCDKSWPWVPFKDLLRLHMEQDFEEHKDNKLDKATPNLDMLLRFYWRNRFKYFVIRELKAKGVQYPGYTPTERVFFSHHEDLRQKWIDTKLQFTLKEVNKGSHGKRLGDFYDHLRVQWMTARKKDFMQRKLGFRVNVKERNAYRRRQFSYYKKCLLGCGHRKCWAYRIRWWPMLVITALFLQLYGYIKPHIFDIALRESRPQAQVDQNPIEGPVQEQEQ